MSAIGGLETPEKFRELQRKLYQKAKQETAKASGGDDNKTLVNIQAIIKKAERNNKRN